MEQRLIDANALIKAICSNCALFLDKTCDGKRISCYPISIVWEQPTVDAVQVVQMENYAEPIKSLRCCIIDCNNIQSRLCNKCHYAKYADGKYGCENKLKADAADSIERLQAEVEEWSQKAFVEQSKAIENLKEVERLKAEVEQLKGECIQALLNGDLDEE